MTVKNKKIKLLVVEDSDVQRELILHVLDSDPDFQVIALAKNGIEAIRALKNSKPDVVLMDLHMPKMNGVEAIGRIMSTNPLPIVAMSASTDLDDVVNGFHALEAGAVAFAEKPKSLRHPQFNVICSELLKTVKLMSEIKVVRRTDKSGRASQIEDDISKNITSELAQKEIQLIAIGVSTGGPVVLQTILSLLPADFPPILIVQHIVPGFIQGMGEWLMQATHCVIQIAENNQLPERSHVYLAPDKHQMGIMSNGIIFLEPGGRHQELCPSVDFLFNTVANVFKDKAIGILLTGMGSDGAQQLKNMKQQGAITIAQDKRSSLIYGMPGQAVALGAATYVLTPEEIGLSIASLSRGGL